MTKSKNADRIGVENIKKKIANGLLPSVRSSQDEDTEISRSIEEVSATSSRSHAGLSVYLPCMLIFTTSENPTNDIMTSPHKVIIIRNVQYQQCLFL